MRERRGAWISASEGWSFVYASRIIRLGAAASVFGGASWLVKAAWILISGEEPPLFSLGLLLFPVGLLGLAALLRRYGIEVSSSSVLRWTKAGTVSAWISLGGVAGAGLLGALFPHLRPRENTLTLITPFFVAGAAGMIIGLILLGLAVGKSPLFPRRGRWLPFATGVGAIPTMAAGGVLQAMNERLIELPIALIGLAWMAIGYFMWRARYL